MLFRLMMCFWCILHLDVVLIGDAKLVFGMFCASGVVFGAVACFMLQLVFVVAWF